MILSAEFVKAGIHRLAVNLINKIKKTIQKEKRSALPTMLVGLAVIVVAGIISSAPV